MDIEIINRSDNSSVEESESVTEEIFSKEGELKIRRSSV